MLFIASDVVVLDPPTAIASEFREYRPLKADFSLPRPYQAADDSAEVFKQPREAADGGKDAPSSMYSPTALPPPAAPDSQQQRQQQQQQQQQEEEEPVGGGSGRKRRSRSSRRSKHQPNEREMQAAARHAAYAPQLAAAATAVAAWLRDSDAATVQDALEAAADDQQCCRRRQQQHQRQEQQADHQPPAMAAQQQQQPDDRPPERRLAEEEPDFRAMYEVRHALKPKFQVVAPVSWDPAPAAATGAAAAATAAAAVAGGGGDSEAARQQDVRQPPACNLFGRLISSSGAAAGGGAAGCSSGSGGCQEQELLAHAGGHPVLLPPRSRFLMSDVRQLQPLLEDVAGPSGGFHCIVLDPPWENASARRSQRYPTLPSRNLLALPLRALAARGGCLVGLWVTNRERHRRFIEQELLPGWGLRHLATWHWLKITNGGEPVGRLDIEHRRPYESLLLCWPDHLPPPSGTVGEEAPAGSQGGLGSSSGSGNRSASGGSGGFHLLQGQPLVIAAVPGAHSRKPHLGPLLLPLLPPGARCLEMFARELHSGWTSWGNEALKFQSLRYFAAAEAAG